MPAKNPAPKELKKTGKGQKADRAIPGNAGSKVATPSATDKKVGKATKPHALPPVIRNNHACRPHPFQDGLHGQQMRVQNACSDKAKGLAHRCTVCGVVI